MMDGWGVRRPGPQLLGRQCGSTGGTKAAGVWGTLIAGAQCGGGHRDVRQNGNQGMHERHRFGVVGSTEALWHGQAFPALHGAEGEERLRCIETKMAVAQMTYGMWEKCMPSTMLQPPQWCQAKRDGGTASSVKPQRSAQVGKGQCGVV